jgi:NADPH:quinone reductase
LDGNNSAAKQFPLAEAAEAHRLMESSQHIGKILLVA